MWCVQIHTGFKQVADFLLSILLYSALRLFDTLAAKSYPIFSAAEILSLRNIDSFNTKLSLVQFNLPNCTVSIRGDTKSPKNRIDKGQGTSVR